MEDLLWSNKEKQIARSAFSKAYEKETAHLMGRAKEMLNESKSPEDVWKLHDYLTEKRREVDRKYDYRYSVLIIGFSRLITEGWITMDDLKGLEESKITKINQIVNFMNK